MKKWKALRRLLIPILTTLCLLLANVTPVNAAVFDDITVTATPAFIAVSIAQDTWTINGIDLSGKIAINTTYYANPTGAAGDTTAPNNPVVDGDCYFMIDNTSTIETDMTANMVHFVGGDAMQNIDTGYANNGANSFGASTYTTGAAWPAAAVILKNAASAALKANVAATTDVYFGVAIKTQSGAWASGANQTSTITVTATDST